MPGRDDPVVIQEDRAAVVLQAAAHLLVESHLPGPLSEVRGVSAHDAAEAASTAAGRREGAAAQGTVADAT